LNNAIIGGSVLNGDVQGVADDLLFLNASGVPISFLDSSGDPILLHVANGFAGDDRIFGSTGDDQLNGGSGNDVLLPGVGDDSVNGGTGTDTFQVLEGARSSLRVDLIEGTSFGQGRDTIVAVENVVASPDQKHQVRGTEGPNAIYTGDSVDVITGLGGNDTIDAGGDDDYIIGGAGADVIYAGAGGIDVMVSGSAAQAGVSDRYVGGDGQDWVSYTSSANTIRFDVSDQSDDPAIGNKFKDYMQGTEASGPVHIDGTTGIITRFDMNGNQVSTDTTEGVEGFMGSDMADTLLGGAVAERLHGAAGNDTIRTGGSEDIAGGTGDDLIMVENVDGGSTALQVDGGGGFDILRLDDVGDARWYYNVQSAIALTLRAHKTTVEGEDLRNARDVFFSVKPTGIELMSLGNFDDHVIYEPGGGSIALFELRDGNDRFDAENGEADVFAGNGNDIGNFNGGGGGIFRGEAGDDYAIFDDTGRDNAALMGTGGDFLQIERFFGNADGGEGYDAISFDVSYSSRIEADLTAGTVVSFKGEAGNFSEQVGMTLTNFEALIATEFNDLIEGNAESEQLLGRGGNDTIRGGDGRDKLYGGDGNDTVEGGDDEDLLHGGPGNDRLDGGAGTDSASYAWVRPDGIDGALHAGNFTSVTASLVTNVTTGAFGVDTLVSIENLIGSGGNDVLVGNQFNNLLSGGAGDDTLDGGDGDDVIVTGRGTDTVSAGNGNDAVVVGLGNKALNGGLGFDTLDFGTVSGSIVLRMETGNYFGTLIDQSPRWAIRDLDGDGFAESDGTEVRLFGGVGMTPQQAREADPLHSNSADDVSRVLPDRDDAEFRNFLLELVDVEVATSGLFAGFEKVIGADSADTFIGDGGANQFVGAAGRDYLEGQSGQDQLAGGHDNDTVLGGDGNDTLFGGTGDDLMGGGAGNDQVFGENGNDAIYGGTGSDLMGGGAGNDQLFGIIGTNTIYGGLGNDTVQGGEDGDQVFGGGGGTNQLFGNAGNDSIYAGSGGDFMGGGADNDLIVGGDGRDTIYGGLGDDRIGSAANNDVIYGVAGSNRMFGGFGNDTINGGTGNDLIFGEGSSGNTLLGAEGSDTVYAGSGNDFLAGGAGNDVVYGGGGANTIYLGLGTDFTGGGAGNDAIFAGAGNNRIYGGLGNDTIYAGVGRDLITGGPGTDVFVFASAGQAGLGAARDVITDFTSGVDRIDLSALGLTFIGGAAFSGTAGELRYVPGFVIGDVNGDGINDFAIELTGGPALTAGDFIL
jgi:Ca2+-binding RTX toxin-like protein